MHTEETKRASKAGVKDEFKSVPMPDLLAKLESTLNGIGQTEVKKRLSQYGPNEIEEKKPIQSSNLNFLLDI